MKSKDPAKAGWVRLPDGADYREAPPTGGYEECWTGIVRDLPDGQPGWCSWLVNLESPFMRGSIGGVESSRARAVAKATRVAIGALGAA